MQNMTLSQNQFEVSKYFSLEDFKNLSLDSLTHTVESDGVAAEFTLSGSYTDAGVILNARVKDKEIIGGNETNSANDYYELIFQVPATSYLQKDYAYKLTCFADGRCILWQYNGSEMTKVSTPSGFAYTTVQYEAGYGADIFIPYSMLQVDKEYGFGNFRFIMRLRNVDTGINAYSESRLFGTYYAYPNTWFVLDGENKIVRRDYDSFKLCDVGIPKT